MNPWMSLQVALDRQAQLRSEADTRRSLCCLTANAVPTSPKVQVATPVSSSACLTC
ncbi:hypothetical protein [Deinococcus yavapaiensis]|uniref:Uncharacterized protein n=1 Tax=Deinococcus yavapaiensis KR-236 TaxID=694435 RepID=A0A318SL53_9DEIO|nr:hypothetical protein [Deinococcus yavapaiensis]PYE53282.1 hypothetical protein DES52_10954 [Deinococcus yavapaiensis KR-236]